MKGKRLHFGQGFRLAMSIESSQAAEMTLQPGEAEGGPDNRHRGSDQWLFVVQGEGDAIINNHSYPLKPGVLICIEKGDTHEIRAAGTDSLRTLNFYVPPAYKADETPLPAGEP